jgi:hypothetical protein
VVVIRRVLPSDVESFVEVASVLGVGVLAEEGRVALEVLGLMDINL